jgi:hypothetical protein
MAAWIDELITALKGTASLSHDRLRGRKVQVIPHLVDGGFADAREVPSFFHDTGKIFASEAPIAAGKATNHRHQLAGKPSKGSKYILVSKEITC